MSVEQNADEIRGSVLKFLRLGPKDGVNIFILHDMRSDRGNEDFAVNFCVAAFPEDEDGNKICLVPFKGPYANNYYRKIFESEPFDNLEKGCNIENIDDWLRASREAFKSGLPFFALVFGVYADTKEQGIYLYVADGITPEVAFVNFQKYTQIQLFGKVLEF